jgi:hypothetical protein
MLISRVFATHKDIPSSRMDEYGVYIPQHRYKAGRSSLNNQDLVSFVRQDGSFIPVTAALNEDYTGLVGCDLPVLDEVGFTIIIRFEVNRPHRLQ